MFNTLLYGRWCCDLPYCTEYTAVLTPRFLEFWHYFHIIWIVRTCAWNWNLASTTHPLFPANPYWHLWIQDKFVESWKFKYLQQCPPDMVLSCLIDCSNMFEQCNYKWKVQLQFPKLIPMVLAFSLHLYCFVQLLLSNSWTYLWHCVPEAWVVSGTAGKLCAVWVSANHLVRLQIAERHFLNKCASWKH